MLLNTLQCIRKTLNNKERSGPKGRYAEVDKPCIRAAILSQCAATGMLQEFLKHAVPDCLLTHGH